MSMANSNAVCSMCGDVGFPDKLFRCTRCRSRLQHAYCTNYYYEDPAGICDWCLSEDRSFGAKVGFHPKKLASKEHAERVDHKVARQSGDREDGASRGKGAAAGASPAVAASSSSSKPMGRRYKLLKDVLC